MPPDSTSFIEMLTNPREWNPATIAAFLAVVVALLSPFLTIVLEEWMRRRKQWLLEREFGHELYDTETIKRATRYYIPPYCTSMDPAQEAEIRRTLPTEDRLFAKIDKYLKQEDYGRHLLLLADSGMGKSSFVLNYYVHNQRRPRRQRHRLAVVPLGIPNAEAHIRGLGNQKETVLFLDAFDEDTKAIADHRARLFELLQLCHDFKRVLITCRTQFFPKEEEMPKETGIVRVGPRSTGGRFYEFWKLYLCPLDDEQVEQWVRKRYTIWQRGKRQKARQAIAKIPLLTARPMLLSNLPEVLETDTPPTTAFQLYELLVEKWLQREKDWTDPEDLRAFSERLAVDLYVNRGTRGAERIAGEELEPLAEQWRIQLKGWQLRGRSLLNRDATGNYKFAHRSVMEYFVVKNLLGEAPDPAITALTDQMEAFLVEFLEQNHASQLFEKVAVGAGAPLFFAHPKLMQRLTPKRRAQIGDAFAQRGDPRLGVTTLEHMEFCLVPAGPFYMGSGEYEEEKPQHLNQHLNYDYWLARYPVTVAQYAQFVEATRHKPEDARCLQDLANRPVRYVTWREAIKFCEWLTEHWHAQKLLPQNWKVQLPSEAEWEKAARGGVQVPQPPLVRSLNELHTQPSFALVANEDSKRRFPWGDEADPNRANYDATKIGNPSAVGCFPNGASPYGCEEMAGNVWQWTRSLWGKDWEKPDFKYPYDPNDGRENLQAGDYIRRVVRGGAFDDYVRYVRCSFRYRGSPYHRFDGIGFRIALSP